MYLPGRVLTPSTSSENSTGEISEIVALYADIRDFSSWTQNRSVSETVELLDYFYTSTWQIVTDNHADFCKFLGDGCLLVWETGDNQIDICIMFALDAASEFHQKYYYENRAHNFNLPQGLGIGIAIGEGVKIQPSTIITELNEVDFAGYPLNCGARMQTLADPYGTVIDNSTRMLIEEQPDTFLYPNEPCFARDILSPSCKAIEKASHAHGLRREDCSGFRYLIFRHLRSELWRVSGIPLMDREQN